jgi:hypothetical protein
MRKVVAIGIILANFIPTMAFSQAAQNLPIGDVDSFCVYGSKIFSVGTVICLGPLRGMACVKGSPRETNKPSIPASWSIVPGGNDITNDGCRASDLPRY